MSGYLSEWERLAVAWLTVPTPAWDPIGAGVDSVFRGSTLGLRFGWALCDQRFRRAVGRGGTGGPPGSLRRRQSPGLEPAAASGDQRFWPFGVAQQHRMARSLDLAGDGRTLGSAAEGSAGAALPVTGVTLLGIAGLRVTGATGDWRDGVTGATGDRGVAGGVAASGAGSSLGWSCPQPHPGRPRGRGRDRPDRPDRPLRPVGRGDRRRLSQNLSLSLRTQIWRTR